MILSFVFEPDIILNYFVAHVKRLFIFDNDEFFKYNDDMSKTGYIYRNFVTTAEIEAYLEARAERDDRSVSSLIRRIIEAEMARDPVRRKNENGHPRRG